MPNPDLVPAAELLATLVAGVPDDRLDGPTPNPEYSVGDLLDHIGGLALAFTGAATKAGGEIGDRAPSADAEQLAPDWRTQIPRDVQALGAAWRDDEAWTGMTKAGGFEMPGEVAGLVALDEIVIHGWDLARATGQPFEPDVQSLEVVRAFVQPMSEPGQDDSFEGLFGPPVAVPEDAPLLDRVVGMTGRDPAWSPS